MDALQLCGGPFSGSSHRGTEGGEEGPFVLGGKGGDSVQGGGCWYQEWGGAPGLRSLLTSACSFLFCCLLHLHPDFFSLCLASRLLPYLFVFMCLWRIFNCHLLTCVLGQGMSPCRSNVLMEVFLPKTHKLSPACVSWFTEMDILNRNDDSKLKIGYKCDVSIIGGQGREVVGYTTESRGPDAREGWGCWQRGGCELNGPSKDAQIQQSSRHFGPNTSESSVHFVP